MNDKLIPFLKSMWENTISPTIKNAWTKQRQNTEDIIQAINDKEITEEVVINNFDEAVNPIVEAQNATTEAIKALPRVEIPETDFSNLEEALKDLKSTLEKKDLTVNIGKTEIDTKSVVKAIEKLEKSMPKMEKQEVIDYTMMFSEMMDIMERPKDQSKHIETQELIKKLARTEDIAILAEYLQQLIDKPEKEFPDFPRDKNGIPYFTPTKVGGGGGGGGLTSIETEALVNLDKSNKLFSYVTQVIDDYTTASTTYFCKMKNDGTWLFVKLNETGNYPVKTFANVSNNPTMTTYDLAFESRTSLTYGNLNTITL